MSKVVLFDAVGTILKTSPEVIEVYHSHGQRHGSELTITEISVRFKTSRQKLFDLNTPAKLQTTGQLISSDSIEQRLWFQLIKEVFVDVPDPAPLFEELWQFFASPNNWRLYHDSAAAIGSLKSAGYLIGIASNFDSRLHRITNAFTELDCVDFVFCSASIGYRKPDPTFYSIVETKIQQQLGAEFSPSIWMTGDCIENDFRGPHRHGWNAFWLNRNGDRTAHVDQSVETIGSLNMLASRLLRK